MRRAGLGSLVAVVALLGAILFRAPLMVPARAQVLDAACRIEGSFTLPRIRVRSLDGRAERAARFVAMDDVAAVLTPVHSGLFQIEGTLPDGQHLLGTVRSLPPLEVREHEPEPGVSIGGGTPVVRLRAGGPGYATVDLELLAGVVLRRYEMACSRLAPVGARPRTSELAFPALSSPHRVSARRDLVLRRPDGAPPLRLRFADPSAVRLHEVARLGSEVEVVFSSGQAHLRGWVEEGDLVPNPPVDSLGMARAGGGR